MALSESFVNGAKDGNASIHNSINSNLNQEVNINDMNKARIVMSPIRLKTATDLAPT